MMTQQEREMAFAPESNTPESAVEELATQELAVPELPAQQSTAQYDDEGRKLCQCGRNTYCQCGDPSDGGSAVHSGDATQPHECRCGGNHTHVAAIHSADVASAADPADPSADPADVTLGAAATASQAHHTSQSSGLIYYIHTLGCQMNVHDSERIAGVLQSVGYEPATEAQAKNHEVDLLVMNTCAVRENAADRMYGTLGLWANLKRKRANMQIAVAGCMAQLDRERIAKKAPWVDAVIGTKNIGSLPRLLQQARVQGCAQTEVVDDLAYFPSELATARASRVSSWVSISVGCNNTCTFCIVPTTRGKERDRRPSDVLAEIRACVAAGAKEVTLLGQNVNSYGYGLGDRFAFSKLLRACGQIEGLERVRFTSPHPAAFSDDVIEAMASTPNVMHQLHMPLQSGSDAILRAMRRSYRRERFMGILAKVRAAMPDAQISTDIIVGFPGETEEDFAQTLEVVEQARFSSAFTFQYSPRPGTPAASMPQVDPDVVQERYNRLIALQDRITQEELAKLMGREVEVMITGTQGRKDERTHRVSGRERTGVLVHVGVPEGQERPQIGDFVTATVTHTAGHYVIADPDPAKGQVYAIRH